VEAEALEFSSFYFHRKRTASSIRFHIPVYSYGKIDMLASFNRRRSMKADRSFLSG